jgi:hypothetical protein
MNNITFDLGNGEMMCIQKERFGELGIGFTAKLDGKNATLIAREILLKCQ